MTNEELIDYLIDVAQDLEKAQMRGIHASHKELLIFTASRSITNLILTLTNEGEANETN
jgi:hypothetical protein